MDKTFHYDIIILSWGVSLINFDLQLMVTLKSKDLELKADRRSTYVDGVAAKEAKLSSVKKVLMLGLVPDCQENYSNVRTLLQKIDLSGLDVSFSVDLKLALYLVGKQSGGCKHPCIYCTGEDPWKEGKLLTLGDLNKLLQDFIAAGEVTKDAMNHNNVVHENLLQPPFSDSTLLLDILNIPELHIFLGVIHKLLSYIVGCFGKMEADKAKGHQFYDHFLKSINVTEKRAGRLEGNQCEKVLDNTNKLMRMAKNLPSDIAVKVIPVVNVLDSFSAVKSSCFGERLNGDYCAAIDKFSSLYRALPGISVPPKMHILEVCYTIN